MKTTVILNGVSVQRDIPTSWDQVTFAQFLALEKCGDDLIQVIALFTGTNYDLLRRSKIVNLDQVIAVLGFLKEPMKATVPQKILGYSIPEKLEFEQVQMYLDLKTYVQESASKTPLEQLESHALYCAVYACREKHGEYDWKKAEEMKAEFMQAPCTEVMGIGNFTLMRLIGLKNNIDLTSRKASSLSKRFKLVLAYCRIRTVLFLRSFNLRKRLV